MVVSSGGDRREVTIIHQGLAVGLGYFRLIKVSSRNWLEIMANSDGGRRPARHAQIRVRRAGTPVSIARRRDQGVYYHGVDSVTGFVLAGGKSSRMGQDKAFMQLGGRTLLAHALELARPRPETPGLSAARRSSRRSARWWKTCIPGSGPLAGIQAALAATRTELNLITAVDMPFLEPDFLKYLIAQARASQAVVVVPRAGGRLQPLCAIYRKDFAEVAERSLRAGRNKVDSLFSEVQTLVIEQEELERNGFTEECSAT